MLLSERSQRQNNTHRMVPFIGNLEKINLSLVTKQIDVGLGPGELEGVIEKGHKGTFEKMKMSYILMWWWLQECTHLSKPKLYTLNGFILCELYLIVHIIKCICKCIYNFNMN